MLLKEPNDADCFTFPTKPELVFRNWDNGLSRVEKGKTFHAQTYCFDTNSERECFIQCVASDQGEEVYFTCMFIAGQSEHSAQYYDADSQPIRSYYPDVLAKMTDGTYQFIKVKDDNKIDDHVVKTKAKTTT